MFSLKNVLIVLIIVIFISSFLTSCKFSKIIDLVHKDTDTFYKKYDFSDSRLKKYQVNGIIFIPYTRQLPHRSYSDKFHYYYLSLASYRKKGDDGKVIINNVELEGVKEVKFKKITKELKQELEFKEYKSATCCNMKSIA